MDLGSLRDLVLDLNFDAHGVAATVTAPEGEAIATTGIWLDPIPVDQPVGRAYSTREPRRVMALRRDEVSEVPLGTIIAAAEKIGGVSRNWQIDGIESTLPDHFRVMVVPETS